MLTYTEMAEFERQSNESRERTRRLLKEANRPDVLAEFDQKMRELDNGIMGAQSCWHSISDAQRRTLKILADGYELRQMAGNRNKYEGFDLARPQIRDAIGYVCLIATVRNLCARDLAHVNGDAFNPERSIVVTERGKFVVSHGQKK